MGNTITVLLFDDSGHGLRCYFHLLMDGVWMLVRMCGQNPSLLLRERVVLNGDVTVGTTVLHSIVTGAVRSPVEYRTNYLKITTTSLKPYRQCRWGKVRTLKQQGKIEDRWYVPDALTKDHKDSCANSTFVVGWLGLANGGAFIKQTTKTSGRASEKAVKASLAWGRNAKKLDSVTKSLWVARIDTVVVSPDVHYTSVGHTEYYRIWVLEVLSSRYRDL